MSSDDPIAVTSRSFSRHPVLREELLDRYSDVRFNDEGRTLQGAELVQFLHGRHKAITALETIDDEVLASLPELRLISKVGVGLDMIDTQALERRGVRLSWSPGTNTRSVSELTLALTLAVLRRIVEAGSELRAGTWRQLPGRTLTGKTIGIVGFGFVGRDLVRLLSGFECRLLAHDPAGVDVAGVEAVGLDELLGTADVVSLHVELNDDTRNLVDARRLALMQPTAVLVNTARGGIVDEDALAIALRDGALAGAALDVLAVEPPGNSELLTFPNVVVTPHLGGSTEEAILAMGRAAIAGLDPQ